MMERIYARKRLIMMTLAGISLVASLFQPSLVNAASSYDSALTTVSTLSMINGTCNRDVTLDWADVMHETTYPDSRLNDFIANFDSRVEDGSGSGWAVRAIPSVVGTPAFAVYLFNPDDTLSFGNYYGMGVLVPSTPSSIKRVTISFDSTCHVIAEISDNLSVYPVDHIPLSNIHFVASDNIIYPEGYEGSLIPTTNEWADLDSDGLIAADEVVQGTSNGEKDTDGDGLSDYIESQWNSDRNDVFCGAQCAYPNPTVRDLYIQVDWMTDPSTSESLKPTSGQLSAVASAFGAQGVSTHFDTGQFGGGNELSTYAENVRMYKDASAVDFYDYKDSVDGLASDRRHIWHYMITGNQYYEDQSSSGAAYVGDDDSFISIGRIKGHLANFPHTTDEDDAIAGTILHELGHNLCLSEASEYSGQPADCIYEGVHTLDDATYSNYQSVMNYTYQMGGLLNYSDGANSSLFEDHDDWDAVMEGMGDFVSSSAEGDPPSSSQSNFLLRPDSRNSSASRHVVN